MSRKDISENLVHWVKGDDNGDAFETLLEIVFDWVLIGSNGSIKGSYNCVCFTEAPVNQFHSVGGRYKQFGILVSKKFLFSQGGRPVIYQSDAEYDSLPESMRWRHVRYEPNGTPPIDFTWEREWRIKIDELYLPPEEIVVLVPDNSWAEAIKEQQYDREHNRISADIVGYGEFAGWQAPKEFHYRVSVIGV